MRRCAPSHVIATSTKIDISGVKIPDNVNDAYFKRAKAAKKTEEGIFEQTQEKYTVSFFFNLRTFFNFWTFSIFWTRFLIFELFFLIYELFLFLNSFF